MRTNTDLTLYRRSIVDGAEIWTRSEIRFAHWENRKAANVISSGFLKADAVVVYIPTYNRTIEINPGDVLVKGIVQREISDTYKMSDLENDYPNVVRVTIVDVQDYGTSVMHHLKVSAS